MRTFLLIAALSTLAAPASAATRNFGIASFSKVRVDGPYKVTLKTDVAPFASATGSPAALDRISIEMLGDTLVVHTSLDSWGGYPGQDVGPVEINLGTHDLSAAWLNGSGSLSIDKVRGLTFNLSVQGSGSGAIGQANVDQLQVSLAGTASARLAGQAAKMTADVRGISSLDAAGLTTRDATLGADGSATIAANVSDSVTVNATGPATVRLTGAPSCTLRVNGSASVSGCH
jgi:hypothetical protein